MEAIVLDILQEDDDNVAGVIQLGDESGQNNGTIQQEGDSNKAGIYQEALAALGLGY